MATRRERAEDTFNELVVLLRRNEEDEKHAADVEMDMRRLLMMARDAHLRDQLVQVQGVRRVTQIAKAATHLVTQRICAGILGNLALSERGRLSASSCDRWNCVSHRHQCPLSMLLWNTYASGDSELMRTSAAALVAFSTQNQCQRHLDALAGIPILLRSLDVKQADGAATDTAIYAAATLGNICKAPALLLKLELYLTETGERGMPVLLEFDGENLNVQVTASISTQLNVVLSIENYTGRARSLADQFRPKTPPASAVASRNRAQGLASTPQAGTSIAHYDESGILASRTCAVCAKAIRVSRRLSRRQPALLCSRDGCGQMLHLRCSRWAMLSAEVIATIVAEPGRLVFFCDVCVLKTSLSYWDFLAAHAQHEQLLTENLFKSVCITRVPAMAPVSKRSISRSTETEARPNAPSQQESESSTNNKTIADVDEEDRSPWPSVMLFDRNANLVGVGDKCFRIPASSRDPEMYILIVRYISTRAYPATRQERAIAKQNDQKNNNDVPVLSKWEVSYARQGALDIPLSPGNAVFWPAPFTRDILALEYSRRTVDELDHAFMYEFQGEQPHDKTFSVGCRLPEKAGPLSSSATDSLSIWPTVLEGLWMNLTPRKGICMKLLAAQLGQLKKLQEVQILHTKKKDKPQGVRKLRKPHFTGQQLNKVAVDTT
ncbi:hypothetical protein ON010_g3093 [Phytophthora cinnamomi]|nr:hypothetical protein ON010_g3093 [Phytophthora cinnamomi]